MALSDSDIGSNNSDMGHWHFLYSTGDRGNIKRQRHATLAFLKIYIQHRLYDGTDLSPLDISVVWSPIYQYYENYHCQLLQSQHNHVHVLPICIFLYMFYQFDLISPV